MSARNKYKNEKQTTFLQFNDFDSLINTRQGLVYIYTAKQLDQTTKFNWRWLYKLSQHQKGGGDPKLKNIHSVQLD